jgi:hypothetical protein
VSAKFDTKIWLESFGCEEFLSTNLGQEFLPHRLGGPLLLFPSGRVVDPSNPKTLVTTYGSDREALAKAGCGMLQNKLTGLVLSIA